MKFTIALVSAFTCAGLCSGQATKPRDSAIASPTAVATNADVSYCLAQVRGLQPERLPPPYLELHLSVSVSYRNAANRSLILPLEHETTIYTSPKPGKMSVFREHLIEPAIKVMKDLPDGVSQDSPVTPKNDYFTVIPAGGPMTPPLLEEITLPVNRKSVLGRSPDLRGHRVYIQLQLTHRELSAALKADLSDRWSHFGVLWTGALSTNTFVVDVPASPQAAPCVDKNKSAHPAASADPTK
jgi:hypothetical protein